VDQDATTILLACLSYASDTIKTERLAHILPEEWRSVAALAQQQAVAPFLYHHLKQMHVAIPNDVAKELRQAYLNNAGRNMRLFRQLGEVLQKFQEENIPVIALKGAYLAETLYANKRLRKMVDVDLLVKKNDLLRIEQVLILMGFRTQDHDRVIGLENKHFTYLRPKSDIHFEIHWVLFESKHSFQIDMQGLWSRAQPVVLAHIPILALSIEDLLLYLCMHTANHMYTMRSSMFCDIGEVVQRKAMDLDWQAIGARAQQWGALRSVYVILRLAQELLGVAVPADWLASIQPAGFEERYLILARQNIFKSNFNESIASSSNVFRLWDRIGFGRKVLLIRDSLLPSRKTMAGMYPAPANSWRIYLYYPVRWKDVLMRYSGLLWRLSRGDSKTQSEVVRNNQVSNLLEWLMSG
jgi:hypothetical protein